ncbi:unnamed protein product [Didymodactylos carnosus]|uniref:Uncharacterized protein n=1 Tax=Didymodactylos carnosus TaxID=1234261 RepID=A0A8S2MYW3_9BILA|nr:unnamed protein product [Didymodactylos carnosus]CAF3977593.1 unnamed protein product [Didymodactylos carnosus]
MTNINIQGTLTVDIDITDIIRNNPLLNKVTHVVFANFRSNVPNANEFPEANLKKIIQRKVNDTGFQPNDLCVGTSTLIQPKRTHSSTCSQARKRIKTVQSAVINAHSTTSDEQSPLKLRDRSKLIKTQYDDMTYYESEGEEDDEFTDDTFLSNVQLLEINIT